MVKMFSESELQFLQNKDLSDYAPGFSIIDLGEYLFKAFGIREDNIITRIELDKKTFEIKGFAQCLWMPEWQILEKLLLPNIPRNCKFMVEGLVIRREDGTGSLDIISLHTK